MQTKLLFLLYKLLFQTNKTLILIFEHSTTMLQFDTHLTFSATQVPPRSTQHSTGGAVLGNQFYYQIRKEPHGKPNQYPQYYCTITTCQSHKRGSGRKDSGTDRFVNKPALIDLSRTFVFFSLFVLALSNPIENHLNTRLDSEQPNFIALLSIAECRLVVVATFRCSTSAINLQLFTDKQKLEFKMVMWCSKQVHYWYWLGVS